MDIYLENLFTPVYEFTLESYGILCEMNNIASACNTQQFSEGISEEDIAKKNMQTYFQSLPGLKGDLVVLKSHVLQVRI